jgi:hypothetical protein
MIIFFAKFSFVLSQKRQFSAEFFGENILKIITSVPEMLYFSTGIMAQVFVLPQPEQLTQSEITTSSRLSLAFAKQQEFYPIVSLCLSGDFSFV